MSPSAPDATTTPWLRRVDPEGRAWRNALRGVVCSAPLFAVYAGLDLVQWAPWAFIGVLNTLLPDIGGPTRPRVRSGVEIVVGSAAAAFLGAVVGEVAVLLVVAMFLVAFSSAYIGVCSPYLGAVGISVLLVFLLSAGTPADVGDAGWRTLHTTIGALLGTIALVALVPAPRKRRIEPALADACRAIADLLDPPPSEGSGGRLDDLEAAARAATGRVVGVTATQRWAPLSSSRVDRARLAFTHDLQSLFTRSVAIHRHDGDEAAPSVGAEERAVAADALRQLASWLVDEGSGPDGVAVRAASDRAVALELELREAALAHVGTPTAFDRFRAARRVAAACRLVAVLVDGATEAAFHTDVPATRRTAGVPDVTGEVLTYGHRLRSNFTPRSMVFRHALRLGIACAIAAAVEQALGLERGYWTVLTVVVSLRTSRGASARRSFERILGTIGGLAVAAGSIAFAKASASPTAVIMVVTIALTALTLWCSAAQLRWAFAVTAITSCVLTMFQLVSPGDWTLEEARLLATTLGVAVSLGVAFVLWPGGAIPALRRALQRAAGANAEQLDAVVATSAGTGDPVVLARRRATALDDVVVCRTTLAAAARDGLVEEDSPFTAAVLEVEQAAELVRRIDDALVVSFRTAPPVGVELIEPAARPAGALLRAAGHTFAATSDGDGDAADRPATDPDAAVTDAWRRLDPTTPLEPAVLDAAADLATLGHRATDLVDLALRAGAADGAPRPGNVRA